jgi:hypothetical protein
MMADKKQYFNNTVIQATEALAAYENAQSAAIKARYCWESCHLGIQKHMNLLEKQGGQTGTKTIKRMKSF